MLVTGRCWAFRCMTWRGTKVTANGTIRINAVGSREGCSGLWRGWLRKTRVGGCGSGSMCNGQPCKLSPQVKHVR